MANYERNNASRRYQKELTSDESIKILLSATNSKLKIVREVNKQSKWKGVRITDFLNGY